MEIKKLSAGDLAKIATKGCNGCGDCCRGMGDTIHLDPYDIWMLSGGLGKSFDAMMGSEISLHGEDGLILPHLKMRDIEEGKEKGDCGFLSTDGRCQIHRFRPGFCRLFPLGRDYDAESQSFHYFVVPNGCDMLGKSKVKISKWLGIEALSSYELFVSQWHFFIKDVKERLAREEDADFKQQLNLFILKVFYQTPYDQNRDFYEQFAVRLKNAKTVLN